MKDRFFAVGRSQNQSLVLHTPLEEYGQRHLDCHQSKLQEKKYSMKEREVESGEI